MKSSFVVPLTPCSIDTLIITDGIVFLNYSDPDDPSIKCEWVQMRPREWSHLDELFAGYRILHRFILIAILRFCYHNQ